MKIKAYAIKKKRYDRHVSFSAKHNIESIVDVLPFSEMNEAIEKVKTGKVSMRLVLENR